MKTRHYLHFTLAVAVLLLGISTARASTVVYQDFDVISSDKVFTTPFDVASPGTYKAELVDFASPDAFDILSLGITQGATALGFGFDTGSFTFHVSTPGTLLAHLAAIPVTGSMGTYALQIKSIPVPTAVTLFFSGLIGLVTVGRRDTRTKMT